MSIIKYPYSFAEQVVSEFCEKYARATKFSCRMLDKSEYELRKHLISVFMTGNSPRWEAAKRAIKHLEHEDWEDYKKLAPQHRLNYITYVKYQSQDEDLNDRIEKSALDSLKQKKLDL